MKNLGSIGDYNIIFWRNSKEHQNFVAAVPKDKKGLAGMVAKIEAVNDPVKDLEAIKGELVANELVAKNAKAQGPKEEKEQPKEAPKKVEEKGAPKE